MGDEERIAQYVQSQLAPLQQQIAAQNALLSRQQALLAQQSQPLSPAAPSPPLAAAGGKPLVKPKPPSTFAASDKVGELDQWEREMRYQFAAYGAALASEESRIAFAVSYLGAVPLQWWDADPSHQSVRTWADFVALLRGRFRPVHAAKQARTELFKIKQAPSQSAGAYAAAFQQLLVSLPDMHVDDQVFLFVRGLAPALKRRVGDKEFVTLSAAINAAVQSEGLYGLQSGDDAGSASSSSGAAMDINAVSADEVASAQREYNRMRDAASYGALAAQMTELASELHALRTGESSSRPARGDRSFVPNLSKELVSARIAAGLCIRCGKSGHFKSECPQRA